MVILPAESNVLARHPIECPRHIPSLIRIAGILGEIGCSRSSCRTVDRQQQNQIPTGIVDLSAANRQTVLVPIEPQPIVDHVTQEALLGPLGGTASTADATTMLASHVAGQREGSFAEKMFLIVVVLDLNAIVRVISHAARGVQRILAQSVLIPQDR